MLERKAPPTFDVLIEIHERDRLAVHHDVAEVVDRLLRGAPPRPEMRVRTDSGVRIETPPEELERARPARGQGHPRAAHPLEASSQAPRAAVTFEDVEPEEEPVVRRGRARDDGRPRPLVRVLPFALSRARVERAIREMGVPARLVERADEADVVLTLKSHVRRQPGRLRQAVDRGLRLEVVRSNTLRQIEDFFRREFGRDQFAEVRVVALREVEDAVARRAAHGRDRRAARARAAVAAAAARAGPALGPGHREPRRGALAPRRDPPA